ncbi:hypothetical protein FH609_018790 [Streptomyces sp. 3MP-14]|uniref:Uncharacterized protein n=1 Tax=Streptomyces mimosae TaxID=2586635 RepID=A0A5N6A8D1_9ACTN|nr:MULTISPECIES: DUF5819 family protein [Streptomyces]KAB8163718.1 hypothetical protein FH607_017330 [Streptomyces mimosae]KAB8175161.1 hypothetical protein FH609_018790 [Streptomyces sp. 3MP-14]
MQPSDTAAGAGNEPDGERVSAGAPPGENGPAGEESLESVRLGSLSLPARSVVAVAVGGLAVYLCWHLAMVFLFVAPSNTVREEHWETVRGYMYPEFEQNWKLFAPNPLQRNTAVHVRAEIREGEGQSPVTTEWIDLTAWEVEHIRHHPLPSHSNQNMLRRAWDFYDKSHNDEGEPVGMRGEVSASYLHRIALERLSERLDVTTVERVQLRVSNTRVPAPSWRREDFDTDPSYQELGWWTVTSEDLPADARTRSRAAADTEEEARP